MIQVCALTSGLSIPSSRFRIRQNIQPLLDAHHINVQEIIPSFDKYSNIPGILGTIDWRYYLPPLYAAWFFIRLGSRIPGLIKSYNKFYDLIWLEREFQPGLPSFEPLLRKPLVWDIDDAIWLKKPFGKKIANILAKQSAIIIAGNSFLANYLSDLGGNPTIIPTAIDIKKYTPKSYQIKPNDLFTIGWTGTSGNFNYLYNIEKPLASFLREHKDSYIHIVSDCKPQFDIIPPDKLIFTKWDPAIEAKILQEFNLGIMPLEDNDWCRGKCSYKILQYMASGLPVIASPVGMNIDVMQQLQEQGILAKTDNEWYAALKYLYNNPTIGEKWGSTGRIIIEKIYSTEAIAGLLAVAFKKVI
jgi:glycosyltransferase involved in cell wall biosynthesis